MTPTRKDLLFYLRQYAAQAGNAPLLFTEDRTWTVGQVYADVQRCAAFLAEQGVGPGAYVALHCVRCVPTVLLWLTLQVMGTVTVLCDPHTSAGACLKASGLEFPTVVCLDAADARGERWVLSAPGGTVAFQIDSLPAASWSFPPARVEAPALVVFTSGSTGRSKGVLLSQYNYLNYVQNYKANGGYAPDDVSPEVLPLHHVFGLAVILTALIHRYRVFFPKTTDPAYLAACIPRYGITRLDSVPSLTAAVAREAIAGGYDTHTLRVGVLGGAPSTPGQFRDIQQALGLKLLPAYGQSECLVISGIGPQASDKQRSQTVGRFLPMSEGWILAPDGHPLPPGQEGEICVRAPEVMLGYYCDPEATRRAVDSQGRLHTGDLGYLDEDGLLHVTGRIKDLIICNGNNLSAAAIERKLLNLPFIGQAAVTALPDPDRGEVPGALIVLRPGCHYDAAAVQAALPKNEVPRVVYIAPMLPLTATGKPDKQRIKRILVRQRQEESEYPR